MWNFELTEGWATLAGALPPPPPPLVKLSECFFQMGMTWKEQGLIP